MPQMTFAQIGNLYNAISNELVGGVTPANQHLLLQQVSTVQTQIQGLINNGTFNSNDPNAATALVHAQNIADQTNFLTQAITNFGTANNGVPATKIINDVARDIQDIVAGDGNLSMAAHQATAGVGSFQQTSNLLTPPTPFMDNQAQDTFLVQFQHDSNSLAQRAMDAIHNNLSPTSPTVQTLIQDINTFATNANNFSHAQGGVFSARFDNELTTNGVAGTAAHELVTGLSNPKGIDANLVNAAAGVLTQNATDVGGNNQFNGVDLNGKAVVAVANGGIPASIPDIHTAGMVFDDAVTKLLGGVGVVNQASVVADLNATQTGLQNVIKQGGIPASEIQHLTQIVSLLGNESTLVAGVNTANPTPVSPINAQIHLDTAAILNIANHDPNIHTAAAGTFIPLPTPVPTPPPAPAPVAVAAHDPFHNPILDLIHPQILIHDHLV